MTETTTDAVVTSSEADDAPPTSHDSGSKSHAATLHDEVNRSLKEKSAQVVRQKVIDTLVEDTLEERKKLVLDGLSKLKTARKEVQTLERKGTQLLNRDKKPVGEMTYTKEQLAEIEKAQQKADKLEKALDAAIGSGSYEKLQDAAK